MDSYSGSCHCGGVEVRASTDLSNPFVCNCSFCKRRGAVLQLVDPEHFQVTSGESEISRYGSRDFSDHFFCSRCGIHVFTRISRDSGSSVAVNLACVDSIDLAALSPRLFDGAELL